MHPGQWLTFRESAEHCGEGWSKDTLERRRDDGMLPSSRQRDDGNRTWEVCHQDLIELGACDCEPFEIVGREETITHDGGRVAVEYADLQQQLAAERARREALEEHLATQRGEVTYLRGLVDKLVPAGGDR